MMEMKIWAKKKWTEYFFRNNMHVIFSFESKNVKKKLNCTRNQFKVLNLSKNFFFTQPIFSSVEIAKRCMQ